jgi:hypothetical protein
MGSAHYLLRVNNLVKFEENHSRKGGFKVIV